MSHICCVDGCSKIKAGRSSDESDFRCFLRWYKFPKNQSLLKKWISRVNLQPSDPEVQVTSMYVCSDHFEDDDFVYRNLLQAELLSSNALAGHHIKLKEDAVPNTDRKTGCLRLEPPKAERALKRSQELIDGIEITTSLSRKKVRCEKLSLKNVDELIWENETIIGGLPSMSAVQQNIKLKNINELISENDSKTGPIPSSGKNSRKFSLTNIDEIISENDAIIGDLQSMTKSARYSLQVSGLDSGSTSETIIETANTKEISKSYQCPKDDNASIATPLSDESNSEYPNVKDELVESLDIRKKPNLSVKSISQIMSQFESMIGNLSSTTFTSKGVTSSLSASDSHKVSSLNTSIRVKEETLDYSLSVDRRNLNLKKIEELISSNKAVIGDKHSTSSAMVSLCPLSDTLLTDHDTVIHYAPQSNDASNDAKDVNFIENINKLISENEAIIGKLPDNNAELYFDFQHDSTGASSSPLSECDSSYSNKTTIKTATLKQEELVDLGYSMGSGNISLKNIDAIIAKNEALVGSSMPHLMLPPENFDASIRSIGVQNQQLESIHPHKDRQFGLRNIDEIISENEAIVGQTMVFPRPNSFDKFSHENPSRSDHSKRGLLVSSQDSKSNEPSEVSNRNLEVRRMSSNLRNIDEIISENESIVGSLSPPRIVAPPSNTATHKSTNYSSTYGMEKQMNSKKQNLSVNDLHQKMSVGYIDDLISENEALLGTNELYYRRMKFATKE